MPEFTFDNFGTTEDFYTFEGVNSDSEYVYSGVMVDGDELRFTITEPDILTDVWYNDTAVEKYSYEWWLANTLYFVDRVDLETAFTRQDINMATRCSMHLKWVSTTEELKQLTGWYYNYEPIPGPDPWPITSVRCNILAGNDDEQPGMVVKRGMV